MTMWQPELKQADKAPYLSIADALADALANGRIRSGEQLPTHRDLADMLGVAIGTVTRAYKEAERRGLVHGEVGRGTFAGPPEQVTPASLSMHDPAQASLIDLSCNYPVYAEDPELGPVLRELSGRRDINELLHYQPHAGTWRHRSAGASWAARYGIETEPESVLVCNGAQHALSVVFSAIAEPGDLILTESLSYPGIKATANLLRLRLQGVPMDDEGLIPDAFASVCRQRKVRAIYLMPTIHNPTASTIPESRRRDIARIAEEHDVAIVEDDVHRLLADDPPPPIRSFAPERTYFIAGLSKSVAGGLRIGFLVSPLQSIERLTQSIWATSWMVAPLTAEIAATWIENGTADRVTERKRLEIKARQQITREVLGEAKYRTAPYAFHIWLELPDLWQSAAFAVEAQRRGVAVTPAEAFAVGNGPAPKAVRVCIGAAENRRKLETGLRLVANTLACPPGTCPSIV